MVYFAFFIAPITNLEGLTTIAILSDCSIQILFSVTQITSNELTGPTYEFTLSIDGALYVSQSNTTNSLTPSFTFSNNVTFTPDICYDITVSVNNCPNEEDRATAPPVYFSLQGIEID